MHSVFFQPDIHSSGIICGVVSLQLTSFFFVCRMLFYFVIKYYFFVNVVLVVIRHYNLYLHWSFVTRFAHYKMRRHFFSVFLFFLSFQFFKRNYQQEEYANEKKKLSLTMWQLHAEFKEPTANKQWTTIDIMEEKTQYSIEYVSFARKSTTIWNNDCNK